MWIAVNLQREIRVAMIKRLRSTAVDRLHRFLRISIFNSPRTINRCGGPGWPRTRVHVAGHVAEGARRRGRSGDDAGSGPLRHAAATHLPGGLQGWLRRRCQLLRGAAEDCSQSPVCCIKNSNRSFIRRSRLGFYCHYVFSSV